MHLSGGGMANLRAKQPHFLAHFLPNFLQHFLQQKQQNFFMQLGGLSFISALSSSSFESSSSFSISYF
jgi:hypothetical protein